MLSEGLTAEMPGPLGLRSKALITSVDGTIRTLVTDDGGASGGTVRDAPRIRTTPRGIGHRVVIGPFGDEPVTVRLDATVDDGAGLEASTGVSVENYRVVEPGSWLEKAAGLSLDELWLRSRRLEHEAIMIPAPATVAAEGMVRCLLEAVEALDTARAAPARQVAGAVRLASSIDEIIAPLGRR